MAIKIAFTRLTVFVVLLHLQVTYESDFNPDNFFSECEESGSGNISIESSKRSRENESSQSGVVKSKLRGKILSYRYSTSPLVPQFTPEKIESVSLMEEQLSKAGVTFKWTFSEVPEKQGKALCLEAFRQESLEGVKISQGRNPDCDIKMTGGPSTIGGRGRVYRGRFFYYSPKENKADFFEGDFLRCNCAYIYKDWNGDLKTVEKSKRFFFLLKQSEKLYNVLTLFGDLVRSREVRVINVLEHK